MRISLDWVSDYVTLPDDLSPEQLAHDLTLKTVEVEDILDGGILVIDNKSLTNRPDLWGHYGIARELAVIYGLPLNALPSSSFLSTLRQADGLIGEVDPALCNRLTVIAFELAPSTTTPQWIVDRLRAIGETPVSPTVDVSNYVMFATGQPTHVYDADRVTGPLSVTATTEPVATQLLNGAVNLPATVPVIRDAKGVLAVAGVMGGAESAVGTATRRYLLEAATFRPQPIRKSSQRLGLRTEASARFEKNLDTQRIGEALGLMNDLLTQVGAVLTAHQDVEITATERAKVTVGRAFLDRRIGEPISAGEISSTLDALGFAAVLDAHQVEVTAPTWRSTGDITIPHDIVEEVARIHGYDNLATASIPVVLHPPRTLCAKPLDRQVREQLAVRAAMTEVITYPWSVDHLLSALGCDKLLRTSDAPAPDRIALRPTLIPNLLEAVAANLRHTKEAAIFEVGTVYGPETTHLAFAMTGTDGALLFRRAKGVLEMVRRYCHLDDLQFVEAIDSTWADASARLAIHAHGRQVGTLGLLSPRVRRLAGIGDVFVACAELDLDALTVLPSRHNHFTTIPELPDAEFDLSVVLADAVRWKRVVPVVMQAHPLVGDVSYVDEFRGSWVPNGHRSLSLRVTVRPATTTLTAEDITLARDAVLDALARDLDAHLRNG